MSYEIETIQAIVEGAILAAGEPVTLKRLQSLFEEHEMPTEEELMTAIDGVKQSCEGRGFMLKEVASGYRFQVREDLATWVNRLWEEKPQKYSRAMLETLALIAYRQPITRGDIEEVRGVAVSSHIIKTLAERDWVKVVGHRDVPGRPSLYATTRQFLDYFNLKSLDELPTLGELRDIDSLNESLEFDSLPEEVKESLTAHIQEQAAQNADNSETATDVADDDNDKSGKNVEDEPETAELDSNVEDDSDNKSGNSSEPEDVDSDVDTEDAGHVDPLQDSFSEESEQSEDTIKSVPEPSQYDNEVTVADSGDASLEEDIDSNDAEDETGLSQSYGVASLFDSAPESLFDSGDDQNIAAEPDSGTDDSEDNRDGVAAAAEQNNTQDPDDVSEQSEGNEERIHE